MRHVRSIKVIGVLWNLYFRNKCAIVRTILYDNCMILLYCILTFDSYYVEREIVKTTRSLYIILLQYIGAKTELIVENFTSTLIVNICIYIYIYIIWGGKNPRELF